MDIKREKVFKTVCGIIKPFARNQGAVTAIAESTAIATDLKVNSARMVDIILDIEDHFNIQVDDESADRVRTVGDVIDLILRKMSEADVAAPVQ